MDQKWVRNTVRRLGPETESFSHRPLGFRGGNRLVFSYTLHVLEDWSQAFCLTLGL